MGPPSPVRVGDLHLVFDDSANRLKVWDKGAGGGVLLFACPARNDTVRLGFFRWGACPRGTYRLAEPVAMGFSVPFGPWFIRLLDTPGLMAKFKRSGIGIHGGGSGLASPGSPRQGWAKTHGCVRLQNADLEEVAELVKSYQAEGRNAYVTVCGRAQDE
jgi:hypothetical protein